MLIFAHYRSMDGQMISSYLQQAQLSADTRLISAELTALEQALASTCKH